jgi:hypothetical protein
VVVVVVEWRVPGANSNIDGAESNLAHHIDETTSSIYSQLSSRTLAFDSRLLG